MNRGQATRTWHTQVQTGTGTALALLTVAHAQSTRKIKHMPDEVAAGAYIRKRPSSANKDIIVPVRSSRERSIGNLSLPAPWVEILQGGRIEEGSVRSGHEPQVTGDAAQQESEGLNELRLKGFWLGQVLQPYKMSLFVSRELATWHCSDLAATLWRTYSG
jgi:hypothetical protein